MASNDKINLQGQSVSVPVVFTFGASGAVPALNTFSANRGVSSVVKGSTGVYVFTFKSRYARYFGMSVRDIKQASYAKAGACKIEVTGVSMSGRTVTILVVDGDGDAVDPVTGDVFYGTFEFNTSPYQV